MSITESLATWLETTRMARAVGSSMWIVASLSAVHVLGYALVMGAALVANLRFIGVIVPSLPLVDVIRPTSYGIAAGLIISIITGVLLVSWKAVAAFSNNIFQLKMLLLVVATLLHFTWQTRLTRVAQASTAALKLSGVIGLLLWVGLAVAAAAYILFE